MNRTYLRHFFFFFIKIVWKICLLKLSFSAYDSLNPAYFALVDENLTNPKAAALLQQQTSLKVDYPIERNIRNPLRLNQRLNYLLLAGYFARKFQIYFIYIFLYCFGSHIYIFLILPAKATSIDGETIFKYFTCVNNVRHLLDKLNGVKIKKSSSIAKW